MKFPNKSTPYKACSLAKFPVVLEALQQGGLTPYKLYKKVKAKFENVAEFIDVLACLYALNKIDFINEEVLYYVENDTM